MPALLYDWDFVNDQLLAAEASQAVVFTFGQPDGVGRFKLKAGTHRFCVEGGHFRSIKLQNSHDQITELTLERNGCAQTYLPEGTLSLRLGYSDGPNPPPWATAVVRADSLPTIPAVPLVDMHNSPLGGYWAIQDNTYNARGTFGNRVLSTLPKPNTGFGPNSQMLVDPKIAFDGLSLWQFPPINGDHLPALLHSSGDFWSLFTSQPYVVNPCDDYCGDAYGYGGSPPTLQIKDLGNYQFVFNILTPFTANLYGNPSNGVIELIPTLDTGDGDTFQVLFRFFPDGTQIGSLNEGEVAIFQDCNFQGRASVFIPLQGAGIVSGAYNLTDLTSSATTLDGTGKSVQVGRGSSIYWGPDASNLQGAVVSNTACLTGSPTGPLFVEPVSNTLVVAHDLLSNSCVDCVLTGQTLNLPADSPAANFSHWNFSGADFSHSALTNLNLSGANLSGAKFIGATLTDINLSGAQVSTNGLDFTGATLIRVKFNGVNVSSFNFTDATLTSIDLSSTRVSGSGLNFTRTTLNQVNLSRVNPATLTAVGATLCGVSLTGSGPGNLLDLTSGNFENAQVTLSGSCAADLSFTKLTAGPEVDTQWTGLNLTGAVITGLQGRVLSTQANPLSFNRVGVAGMSLEGVVLDYAQGLEGSDLTGVQFNNTSLRYVNLSGSKLYGATLINADLEGANLSGSFLTNNPNAGVTQAASLTGAHLKNVNLANAQLSGANFANASFYGTFPVGQNTCSINEGGFTQSCASASGATMNNTQFGGAYLYGVDFTNTTVQGVQFGNAVLIGANFAKATLSPDPSIGTESGFTSAFLQGTNLAAATLNGTSLAGAFVDFQSGGNDMYLRLDSAYSNFPGWKTPGQAVCVFAYYGSPTTVPTKNTTLTCPDGSSAGVKGCGPTVAGNTRWASSADISQANPAASYMNKPTYGKAAPAICSPTDPW